MSQEFQPHPVIVNYEASRDGIVRHRRLKKIVGADNGRGYLVFTAGGKIHLNHRFVFEVYNGLIKDGFVIDHIDSNCKNNSLSNLQAISQSENLKRGRTGKHSKNAKPVKSFNTENNEEIEFQSIYAADDGEMIPIREWHDKDDRAFLRYGMECRHGRLVVPAKGTYFIHSFLDLYETTKNTSSRDDAIYNKRHADNYQLSLSIKHSIYRFNIINGIEEELIRTEQPREVSQNGYFNIYDSYLSAAVNLDPGDEVYVKISDLDLLAHPRSNFFGVSMI